MTSAVVLAAGREPHFSASFVEQAARRISEWNIPDLEFHLLVNAGVGFPATIPGVRLYHYPGGSQTELLRHHLHVTPLDRVVRLSPSANLGEDAVPRLLEAVAAQPESLVFHDFDPAGRFVLDGFTTRAFNERFGQFDWVGGFKNPAFRATDDSEYFFLPNIPRSVPTPCCHPSIATELEAIATCRFWFHPVRIDQRTTYCAKRNKHLLDEFLTNVEHRVFKDKTVLELGCWDGGLGSQALDAGASLVHFTDSPLRDLDWRYPYPTFARSTPDGGDQHGSELTIGEVLGSLPLVLRHRDPARVLFSRANCYDLSSIGRSYDVSLLCGILYHVFDPVRAIQEVCSVTRDTVIVGTTVLEGREPVAYLQEPLESDSYDTTTWFQMSFPFLKMLFAHCGFERAAMLGGGIPNDGSWKTRNYRYMIFGRTFGAPRLPAA